MEQLRYRKQGRNGLCAVDANGKIHNIMLVSLNYYLFNGYEAKAFGYLTKLKVWAMSICLAAGLTFIIPELNLFYWLGGIMTLDIATAYVREKTHGRKFTSKRMRESLSKTIQYTMFLTLIWALMNISGQEVKRVILVMNACYIFLILIESKSVGENIRDINPDSMFSKVVLSPFISLIDGLIKRKSGILKQAADDIASKSNDEIIKP